ncbi:glutamine synthetase [Phototrophicus methaneseepsis]|uniref:Glutamine synthetase n=2 Tax=Phototrophicus methaneseepsis TaxID=2710758 RepID=A0A7S8IDH1_9CHLR|nr:glutamine synthetase [Phototrophicus methaneseepsis]
MALDNFRRYAKMTRDEVLSQVDDLGVRFVLLWFTDIVGNIKSVMIPSSRLPAVIDNGIAFDGSAIEGFARVAESDMLLVPDLSTFAILPWNNDDHNRTARFICTIHTPDGEPFKGDPRYALQRAISAAEEMGFRYMTGMELEFFMFYTDDYGKPVLDAPQDNAAYFDLSNEPAQAVRRDMLSTLEGLHIGVDTAHSETGRGQHEIDIAYSEALVSADHLVTTRVALKTVAQQHRLHCTFMPRPMADMPGSGLHTHQSLHDLETGANVFFDPTHPYGLSETARYFLAGQLAHARAMCAILAPLVNSYKRLGTSFEAPVYVTWAHINRGALIRVPGVGEEHGEHTRLEMRCPDPSTNPYLAKAAMLMAGLEGIRQKLPLPEAREESLFARPSGRMRHVDILPSSLAEALEVMSTDDVVLNALGPYISDRYADAKHQEFDSYNEQITPWEIERYLNRF